MKQPRHFLTLLDLSASELKQLVERSIELKKRHRSGNPIRSLTGKVLGMIFDKSSTRTRVSFEAGIAQLGGSAIFLSRTDSQLGRGESIEDSARVISSMLDLIVIRTYEHASAEVFAKYSRVPVINGLTDRFHPCQLLADIQTYTEHRGNPAGATVAWVGDGNNMCHSYINAARLCDFKLQIACPENHFPDRQLIADNSDRVTLLPTPQDAVSGADWVVTDTWTSMGKEQERTKRLEAFSDFQVDEAMMALANKDAIFMHCLPAYRGMEISDTLLDDPCSVVWDEAENRLHAQKALMEFLLIQT
jgi:ornithine carbamoyltransferase